MSKTVIVTGGSSGIGLETARALRSAGCKVYTISRRDFSEEGLTHVRCDITDEKSVGDAVEAVIKEAGAIDILVNAAGFGISGAIEFTELSDAKLQFDVNFFGMVNVNKAVIPHMRERRAGLIVNVSSMAAPVGIPFQAYYSASKAAIDTYTLSLRNELRPFGVRICSIEPGDIATAFTDVRKKSCAGDEAYNNKIRESVSRMEKDERNGMSAECAGMKIAKIALKSNPKPIYTIDFISGAEKVLLSILPKRLSNWIVGKMY